MPNPEKFTPQEARETKKDKGKLKEIKKIIKNESHDFVKEADKFMKEMKTVGISKDDREEIKNIALELDKQENYSLRAKHYLQDKEFAKEIEEKIEKLKNKLDEIDKNKEEKIESGSEAEVLIQELELNLSQFEEQGIHTSLVRKRIEDIKSEYDGDKKIKELESLKSDLQKMTATREKEKKTQTSKEDTFQFFKQQLESGKGKFKKDELDFDKQILKVFIDKKLIVSGEEKGAVPEDEVWVYGNKFKEYDSYEDALGGLQKEKEEESENKEQKKESVEEKEMATEQKEKERAKETFATNALLFVQGIDKAAYNKYGEENKEYGDSKELLENAETVTMSDTHGSALKILETAVASEMVTMPEESEKKLKKLYEEMVKIGRYQAIAFEREYPDADFSFRKGYKERREEALELIKDIEWVGEDRRLVLIGDVLADRGLDDKITLKLIEKLRENGNVSACMSDHDWDLLARTAQKTEKIDLDAMSNPQRVSLIRTARLEKGDDSNMINNQKNREMYKDYWLNSNLFIFDEETSTLYTHANITSDIIEKIKKHLPSFDEATPINEDNFFEFIQEANEWMRSKFIEILDPEKDKLDREALKLIDDLMWTRERGDYADEEISLNGVIDNFVHGHGGKQGVSDSEYRVDSRKSVNEGSDNIDSKYNYNSTEDKTNVFKLDDKHMKSEEIGRQDKEFRLFVTTEEDRKKKQRKKAA